MGVQMKTKALAKYRRAHEEKNRGRSTIARRLLREAAVALKLSLDWTEDSISDWENNIGAVDAAFLCQSESD
jgi:hypothetical protein